MSGEHEGLFYVTVLCLRCSTQHEKLPVSARRKITYAAHNRIVKNPQRYPVKLVQDSIEARILQGLAEDPATGFATIRAIIDAE